MSEANPCDRCNWNPGDCDFCPHSSSGRMNLNKRMYGDDEE